MLPPPQLVGEVGGALQQTGVEVEHVAGVGLPARGPLQQQAQRPVGDGVLAQIVVYDQHVPALVHEKLSQGAPGIGGDILQGGRALAGALTTTV